MRNSSPVVTWNGKPRVEIVSGEMADRRELCGRARLHEGRLDLFHPQHIAFKGDGDLTDLEV